MRIVIVGGGIGGLSAALVLGGSHDVLLCEAASAFEPVGAGIVLAPNAVARGLQGGVPARSGRGHRRPRRGTGSDGGA